jgi:hypothetical protein
MRVMTRKQSEMLSKLLTLARGDTAVVNQAMLESARTHPKNIAELGSVITFILAHRPSLEAAHQARLNSLRG